MIMFELSNKLRNFAYGLGLACYVSNDDTLGEIKFEFVRHEDDRHLSYTVNTPSDYDEAYVRITNAIMKTFVGEVSGEEDIKEKKEEPRTTDTPGSGMTIPLDTLTMPEKRKLFGLDPFPEVSKTGPAIMVDPVLTKNEYIALELTKAWASGRSRNSLYGPEDYWQRYKEFVELCEKEDKNNG